VDAQARFQVIRETWDAFNRDDVEEALTHIHADASVVPFGAALDGKRYDGHAEIERWYRDEIRADWEEFITIPQDFREAGDMLVVYGLWQARGRDSGIDLEVNATWVVEVRDGKIAYWQTFTDRDEAHAFAGLQE
jgi:ketosteroid isomerase-like protein